MSFPYTLTKFQHTPNWASRMYLVYIIWVYGENLLHAASKSVLIHINVEEALQNQLMKKGNVMGRS